MIANIHFPISRIITAALFLGLLLDGSYLYILGFEHANI